MPKSTSDRSKNGSEVASRLDRRHDEDEETYKSRHRADPTATSSSRRISSKRDDEEEQEEGFIPTSTSFSSSSRSPYAGVAAPSVASSYATAFTDASSPYTRPPDLVRNDSMAEAARNGERRESRREGKSGNKSERSRRKDESDDGVRNVGRGESDKSGRRDSRKSSRSDKKEKSRSFDAHDAALPQNQFPGEIPDQYTRPYRPPGQASEYYGDQGESVSFQPGVRPNPPSVIHTADQAHLMEPTTEAKPPPEPSSVGQIGAAASFFAANGNTNETGQQSTPTKSGRKPSKRTSAPINQQPSPRGSPGLNGKVSGSLAGSAIGAAAVGAGIGAAAEYYSGNFSTSSGPAPTTGDSVASAPPRTDSPESYVNSSRPSRPTAAGSQPDSHHYGAAAAAGLAGAAAGAYLSNQHHQSETQQSSTYYANGPSPNFSLGQNQSAFPQMQGRRRQQRRGPLGKLVSWFKDPDGVAEFEQYTEAIGVCRYCFDPNSSPLDAPRKHHYHHHGPSGGRHGNTTRVNKTYRYSSSDDDRRRGSAANKVVVGGLAGYDAAKIGEAIYRQKHDFDDTYSVKSGRPANRSRVSFKEDEDYHSTRKRSKYGSAEDVRLERRDSGRKSRRNAEMYEKRSSRRRSSSSSTSTHGISRGAALSLGAGAAGLATGAATAYERRKSRSRSRSPSKRKKGYYSKRISPRHSYVDLNSTDTGVLGLGGFFSPSANKKKGKRPKGFFTFTNASGSSSDADLAFGAGTVRRKDSKKDRQRKEDVGSTAALMGLAATGAALAAESDRRKSKGKDPNHADQDIGRYPRRSGAGQIKLQDHETTTDGENDDVWEDASDDDDHSSVDTALAYGGRLSAAQSRESLNQGTDKWDYRWKKNKDQRNSRRESQPEVPQGFDAGTAAMIGIGIGAAAAGTVVSGSYPSPNKAGSLPPMQHLDPIPTTDPTFFEAHRSSVKGGISPGVSAPPSQHFATSEPIPLQQPQPIVPIGAVPGAFDGAIDDRRRLERDTVRRLQSRRDSSPAKLSSRESQSNISFAVRDEDPEKEQRRKSRREEKERRRSADAAVLPVAPPKEDEDAEAKAEAERRAAREAEIEAELDRLYEEDRRRNEERKRKDEQRKRKVEAAGVAAAAAVVGAGIAASAIAGQEKRSESSERERPVRKSSLKKTKDRSNSPAAESQQERIARMAAQRVRSTPSPVHDDYSTFFMPKEIADHVKEHNDASAHRDDSDAHVVEIVPGRRKEDDPFDPFNYRPFGIDPEDDPTAFPWPVPALDLIAPTPEGSRPQTPRALSPVSEAPKENEVDDDDFGEKLERKGSRVTWGDDDINVYEVVTPMYERSDFISDSPPKAESPTNEAPQVSSKPDSHRTQTQPRSKLSRAWSIDDDEETSTEQKVPPVEEMTAEQREHVAKGKDFSDLPPSDDRSQARDFAAGEDEPRPTMDVDLEDILGDRQYYQSPFSDAVGGLDDAGPEPKTGHGHVGDVELPETPRDETPVTMSEEIPTRPRLSKSERRRMERAASSGEAIGPEILPESIEEISTRDTEPNVPSTESVFDFLVHEEGKSLPPVSALGVAASSVLSNGQASQGVSITAEPRTFDNYGAEKFSKPKRASTFDEPKVDKREPNTGYASDPENWEYSVGSNKGRNKKSPQSDVGIGTRAAVVGAVAAGVTGVAVDDDFYVSEKKKRRSRHESEVFEDDDVRSVASTPATADEKRSRRKYKGESERFEDNDTRSVASSPAESRKTKSKDKEKDKRSGAGLWGSIFGAKSDVSTSTKKSTKSSKPEDRVERGKEENEKLKKRLSQGTKLDDTASVASNAARSTKHDSAPLAEQKDSFDYSRDQSVDDGFVSADQSAALPDAYSDEQEPFLAERPDMPQQTAIPMATDGVSGLKAEGPTEQQFRQGNTSRNLPTERPTEQPLHSQGASLDWHSAEEAGEIDPIVSLESSPESGRVSALRTDDSPGSPATASSPTAVPLQFRRLPVSPATPRASWSSPLATPSSPLATPRTRQSRPHSTEFRSSKEIRPLYLVQKTKAAQAPTPEIDEDLPSLPSSRTSSAHPSMEDLRGQAKAAEAEDYFGFVRITPEKVRDRGRRHSYSYWHDEPRRQSPDYLDSRSATPVPADVQKLRDTQPKKEKPRYEFHSPSELLQDPAMIAELADMDEEAERASSPLPSVISTEHDQDFTSARGSPLLSRVASLRGEDEPRKPRPRSRSRSRSRGRRDPMSAAGLGIAAGTALGLAASTVLFSDEQKPSSEGEVREVEDMYGPGPPPSAPSPPPTMETPAKIMQELEEQRRELSAKPELPLTSTVTGPEAETPVEAPAEDTVDLALARKAKKEKRKSKDKRDIFEPGPELGSQSILAAEAIVPAQTVTEDDWTLPTGKKTKKEKKTKRKESLPPLDIARAEAKDESGARIAKLEEDEPVTAVPSEISQSRELPLAEKVHAQAIEELKPQAEAVTKDLVARRAPGPVQPAEKGDLTHFEHSRAELQDESVTGSTLDRESTLDLPTAVSERASRTSFPWDDQEATMTPPSTDQDPEFSFIVEEPSERPQRPGMEREASFVPSTALLNQPKNVLSAFEEAFERAVRVRGLAANIGRDEALHSFLPKRDNAPFIAKGGLTPISQNLATTSANSPPVEAEEEEEEAFPLKRSRKDKKKGKQYEKRGSSKLRNITTDEDGLEDIEPPMDRSLRDTALMTEPRLTSEQLKGVARALAQEDILAAPEDTVVSVHDPNPFGDDFEVRDDEVAAAVAESDDVNVRTPTEQPQTQGPGTDVATEQKVKDGAEEFPLSSVSKRDKKKKKKSQSSTPAGIATPTEEVLIEATQEPVGTPQEEMEDPWAPSSSKKSKSSKKDKKRQTLDWTEGVAPAVAGAAIGAAATAMALQDDAKQEEIVPEPVEVAEPEPVTFAEPAQLKSRQDAMAEDVASFMPTDKKGKKSKKKSKAVTFEWESPEAEAATPEEPQTEPQSADTRALPETVLLPGVQAEDVAAPLEVSEPRPADLTTSTQELGIAAEDDWAPVSAKLSKKDKKKAKKGKSITFADLEGEAVAEKEFEAPTLVDAEATLHPSVGVSSVSVNDVPQDLPTTAELEPTQAASGQEEHDIQPFQDLPVQAQELVAESTLRLDEGALRDEDDIKSAPAKDTAFSRQPAANDVEDILGASAQAHHDDQPHQDFLTDAYDKVADFPLGPGEVPESLEPTNVQVEPASAKSVHLVHGEPSLTATETPIPTMEALESQNQEDTQEDDIVFAPAKKSKKDKKKAKRKSTTLGLFDEPESNTTEKVPITSAETPLDPQDVEPTAILHLEEVNRGIVPEVVAEPVQPLKALSEQPEPFDDAPGVETPAETPAQETDDLAWTASKKGRKDKKKFKKRSMALDWSDEAPAGTFAGEDVPPHHEGFSDVNPAAPAGEAVSKHIMEQQGSPLFEEIRGVVDSDAVKERDSILELGSEQQTLDFSPTIVKKHVDTESSRELEHIMEPVAGEHVSASPHEDIKEAVGADVASELDQIMDPVVDQQAHGEAYEEIKEAVSHDLAQERDQIMEPIAHEVIKETVDADVAQERDQIMDLVSEQSEARFVDAEVQPATAATPQQTPAEEVEEFNWSSGKNKKDRKKTKKRATLPVERSENASPPTETINSEALTTGQDLGLGLAAGAALAGVVTAATTNEPEITPAETPSQEQDDFSWQPSTKKSKKDKKKRKTLAWTDEEPVTPVSQDETIVATAEELAGDITGGQPATIDEVERHAQFSKDVSGNAKAPIPGADGAMEGVESEPPPFDEQVTGPPYIAETQVVPKPQTAHGQTEEARVEDTLRFEPRFLSETELTPATADGIAEGSIVIDAAAQDQPAIAGALLEQTPAEEPEELSWAPAPGKKGKKAKKKKTSAFTFDEPSEGVSTPEPESEPIVQDVAMGEPQPVTIVPEGDALAMSSSIKQSKKDKRKKRETSFLLDEPQEKSLVSDPVSVTEIELTGEPIFPSREQESATKDLKAEPLTNVVEPVADTFIGQDAVAEPPPQEDEWGTPIKKGKKDKKKKRGSTFTLDEPQKDVSAPVSDLMPDLEPTEQPVVPLVEPEPTVEVKEAEPSATGIAAPVEETYLGQAPVAKTVPEEDEWAMLSSGSKKGKKDKKKRVATFALDQPFETVSTPVPEEDVRDLTAVQEAAPSEEPPFEATPVAETAATEDQWTMPATGKKSKKDKKKKRTSAFDWDEPSGPSTPQEQVEPNTNIFQEDMLVPDTDTRARDVHFRGANLSQGQNPLKDVEMDGPLAPAEPEPETEPEPEDEWASPTAGKKKQKDKKTKRASIFEAEAAAEEMMGTLTSADEERNIEAPLPNVGNDALAGMIREAELEVGPRSVGSAAMPVDNFVEPAFEPESYAVTDDVGTGLEPEAWTSTTKKDKKVKKKKDRLVPAAFGDEGGSGTATPATPMEVVQESPQIISPEATTETVVAGDVQDIVMTEEPAIVEGDRLESAGGAPREQDREVVPGSEPFAEDAWLFTPKKSKKDKKKKRQSTLQEEELVSATPMEVSETATPVEPIGDQIPQGEPAKHRDVGVMAEERASAQEEATSLTSNVLGSKESNWAESPARSIPEYAASDIADRMETETPASDPILPTATESASDALEGVRRLDVPAQEPQPVEELWGISTKKLKKDKKKQRQSTFDDLSAEPVEDGVSRPRDMTASDAEPQIENSFEGQTIDQLLHPSSSKDVDMAEPAQADDSFWAPTKKSKKDKKKKRQSAFDENEPVGTGITTPVAIDEHWVPNDMSMARSVDEVLSDPIARHKTDASQLADLTSPAEVKASEDHDFGESHQAVEFSHPLRVDRDVVPDPASQADAHPVTVSLEQVQNASARDHHDASSHQDFLAAAHAKPAAIPQNTIKEVEATKAQEPVPTYKTEVVRDTLQPQDDDWYGPASKSKKDKKKTKRQPTLGDTDVGGASDTPLKGIAGNLMLGGAALAGAAVANDALTQDDAKIGEKVAEEEELGVSRKQSKKDKKKKKKSMLLWDDENEPPKEAVSSEEAMENEIHPAEATADPATSGYADEPPAKFEVEERRSIPQSSGLSIPDTTEAEISDLREPDQPQFVPSGFSPEPSGAFRSIVEEQPLEQPFQPAEDDWYAVPKKAKKSKKDKKSRKSTGLEYYDEASTAPYPLPTSQWAEEVDILPEAPEPQPAVYAAPSPPPAVPEESRDISIDSDEGSNVSEATRERRRQRRSPPVWTGEEPPDLPRGRALTPPPEHNDIMDTALGVAAGLGFGASEGDRRARVRSPSRSREREREESGWSFATVQPAVHGLKQELNRDSGVQFDSPTMRGATLSQNRDSGYMPSPAVANDWDRASAHEHGHGSSLRPIRQRSTTSSSEDLSSTRRDVDITPRHSGAFETSAMRSLSPVESTSKDRSSVLFKSSPTTRPTPERPHIDAKAGSPYSPSEIRRSPSIHGDHMSRRELRSASPHQGQLSDSLSPNLIHRAEEAPVNRDVFSPPPSTFRQPLSPPKSPLQSIPEHGGQNFVKGAATAAAAGGAAAMLARDNGSRAKSLGRSKSRTSSLRNLRGSLSSPFDPRVEASSSRIPVDGLQGRDREMADQFEGYGHYPGSPISPTRPPSITKRRSMQQMHDLQSKVEQLANENRSLAEAKITAEHHLEEFHLDRSRNDYASDEALATAHEQLRDRDEEIARLKEEVAGLAATHETLRDQHEQRYSMLVDNHVQERGQWEEGSRELETLRGQHSELSTGMEDIVRHEIDTAVAEKNAEIERLNHDLELAKEKIRELQSQILAQGADEVVVVRDEDYFDTACQQLCQHVQQWVLRYSKFSDTRVCRSTNEVRDEKIVDRFDNAILDGSDVDGYLSDRVKRRDVFMSVVMTMIWEYVFTRYLFGMDRDQRQKLKQLEKNLSEVGSVSAVHQWRAMTLTLLAKRDAFKAQCEQDTEAVAIEIFGTLSRFLPPPGNLEAQIQESLRNVMRAAVSLSVEMRCQRAEFIMLPPLQPEYDTNGDLARKVYFNASLMNERSGETTSNEELEQQQAVVRMVLFPLVVKKGSDVGEGEDEIVVCPAQVLVARERKGKGIKRTSSRITSGQSQGGRSTHSLAMSAGDGMGEGEMI